MSVGEKIKCIEPKDSDLSISRQCDLLRLPRSSYYRPRVFTFESNENLELMRLIDEEFLRHPFYGSRKMRDYLNRQGFPVNRKRVQRLMRLMGIVSAANHNLSLFDSFKSISGPILCFFCCYYSWLPWSNPQ